MRRFVGKKSRILLKACGILALGGLFIVVGACWVVHPHEVWPSHPNFADGSVRALMDSRSNGFLMILLGFVLIVLVVFAKHRK